MIEHIHIYIQNRWKIIGEFISTVLSQEFIISNPLIRWVLLQVIAIWLIIIIVHIFKKTKVGISFALLFEEMYKFFEEILGEAQKKSIKIYVVSLFFVILTSNLLSYIIDLIRIVFVDIDSITRYITIPTTDFNFNLALAIVSIMIMLYIQFRRTGLIKFVLEYIPITWKGILTIERWNMPALLYYPSKVIVKVFDIGISLFVWLLDIIWIWAKAISLTARLYGNMLAWWILLWLLIAGMNTLAQGILGTNFPVLWPLILYAQGLLVACIQAFVFPLLVAIFIKIAQEW